MEAILDGLETLYPDVDCELDRETPFQLLCATILSAQCTDERVNKVTPELFRRFPTPRRMAAASLAELEEIIRSTGFFRQKAKSLKGTAALLAERLRRRSAAHASPSSTRCPASRARPRTSCWAPRTASPRAWSSTRTSSGSACGSALTRKTDPKEIEQDLMQVLPQDRWIRFSHQLIWHGRRVCFARKPDCGECLLAPHCPSAGREG